MSDFKRVEYRTFFIDRDGPGSFSVVYGKRVLVRLNSFGSCTDYIDMLLA